MGFFQEDSDKNRVQLVSAPSDVPLQYSLEESIKELRQFDNAQLFPYISKLFAELLCDTVTYKKPQDSLTKMCAVL